MEHVYFIGIGGIGMSAIARYYNAKGYKVSGYDKTPSPLTHALEAEGIDVHYEDNTSFVPKDVDNTLVVYTPAIPKDMGELVYPSADGTGGSANKIEGEFLANGYPNTLRHEKGVISMARAQDMNSASSQFFICNDTNSSVSSLNGKYAAFGHVIEGIEVVDSITSGTAQYGDSDSGTIQNKNNQAVITEMKVINYGNTTESEQEQPETPVDPLAKYTEDTSTEGKDYYYVAMNVKDHGTIVLKLDAKTAPITVANFVSLVREDFYDGLTFHRVIDGFMIQGGDPNANGTGGSANKIEGEFLANGYPNTLRHEKGVISMARAQDMNSASSQFFICNATNSSVSSLDGSYAAFGYVIEGIEVVDSITSATDKYGDYNGTIQNKSNQAVIVEMKVIEYTEA